MRLHTTDYFTASLVDHIAAMLGEPSTNTDASFICAVLRDWILWSPDDDDDDDDTPTIPRLSSDRIKDLSCPYRGFGRDPDDEMNDDVDLPSEYPYVTTCKDEDKKNTRAWIIYLIRLDVCRIVVELLLLLCTLSKTSWLDGLRDIIVPLHAKQCVHAT